MRRTHYQHWATKADAYARDLLTVGLVFAGTYIACLILKAAAWAVAR